MTAPARFSKITGARAQTPVGTAFMYQGKLTDAGAPASGIYDFEFTLHDAATDGAQVGSTVTKEDVAVADGLFVVALDFGSGAFTGNARWLQIGVRPGSSTGAFTRLASRQELTPAPNAIYSQAANVAATATTATSAATASAAPWAGITDKPAGFADDTDNDALSALSCASDQVAKWSGTAWACAQDTDTNSGGDITGVAAGAGLTGGGNTGDVALALDTATTEGRYVLKSGDTMTGNLTLSNDAQIVALRAENATGDPAAATAANAGRAYYNATTKQLAYSDGSTWVPMGLRYAWVTGSQPDNTDSGSLTGRTVTFNKARDNTRLRITYSDNFRVLGPDMGAVWEIKLDGVSISNPWPIKAAFYSDSGNRHVHSTIVGLANGVSAGVHAISVFVSSAPGYSGADCYTGWGGSTFLLEVEEIP